MFQVLDECPCCRVESAVAALFDPAHVCCLLGVAASSRCRLCGRAARGRVNRNCPLPADAEQRLHSDRCPSCEGRMGERERLDSTCSRCGIAASEEEIRPGQRFAAVTDLEDALRRWAREEGHDSTEQFVTSSFLDGETSQIYRRIRENDRVETNFDVLAFLFPELAVASAVPSEAAEGGEGIETRSDPPGERPERSVASEATPTPRMPPTDPGDDHVPDDPVGVPPTDTGETIRSEPWASMLPLVSVMVADGRVHPAEEAFLQRFLAANQCPPIPAELMRVHRPGAVPVPPDPLARERMLEAMVHLVHVDRLRDGTEFRVVEEFARAWDVPPQRVAHWDQLYRKRYAAGLRRLWLILQSTFTKD